MSDQTSPGAALIVKTRRVTYTVTDADISGSLAHVDAVWDTPFADVNYAADTNVETTGGVLPEDYFVYGFTKSVDKISAAIGCAGSAGDVIVLHAFGIHD